MAETPAASLAIAPLASSASGVSRPGTLRLLLRDRAFQIALAFLLLLGLAAVAAPVLGRWDPTFQIDPVGLKSKPPSADHWLGTDPLSRDVFSRLLHGTRISLRIALLSAALSGVAGLLWGAIAGFVGGTTDAVLMRVVDTMLAIPRVLLVLTVIALWPELGTTGLVLVLGLTGWFGVSRLARAEAMALRSRDFVLAARSLGVPATRVFVRHVLPHALGPVLVAVTIAVGHALVLEVGLTYLGVGVRPPTATWGSLIADGRDTLATTWWLTVFPGILLIATSLAVHAVANSLRAAINPRQLPPR